MFLPLVGFILGYFSFSIAIFRTDRYPRRIGFVLSVPEGIVVLMLVHIAAGYASPTSAFVISAGEAMAHLAIGATLTTSSAKNIQDQTAQEASGSETDVELTMYD